MKVLKIGSQGPQVELVQLALSRRDGGDEAPDGIYGPETRRRVTAFQNAEGISADGIVGPQTWKKLEPWLTGFVLHKVAPGDSFYKIAAKYGGSVRAIDAANPGADPFNLKIGSVLTVPLGFEVVPGNISFGSAALDYCLRGLKARYPFLQTGSAGYSSLGRPLHWVKIGNGELETFYNAAHHANEWITAPVLMKFLERYAEACVSGGEIGGRDAQTLLSHASLYIMPMVNPDGVDLVTGDIAAGSAAYNRARELASNYPGIAFPSGWKANINGVDLNLQYPASWQLAKKTKFELGYTQPGPRDYVGKAALSQAESRAVYDFTVKRDFSLTLSYHTQGRVIYWKYLDREPLGSRRIGEKLARLSGYALELTPPESAYAGYKDWFIGDYNRPGYTIEVGSGESPVPIAQFEEIYAENEALLSYAITAVEDI